MAVEHYVLHGGMSGAYRHAYSTANMQPATANRRAIELFDRPQVAARVVAPREESDLLSQLSREKALAILARIARGELPAYLDESGGIDTEEIRDQGGPDVEAVEEPTGGRSPPSIALRMCAPILEHSSRHIRRGALRTACRPARQRVS